MAYLKTLAFSLLFLVSLACQNQAPTGSEDLSIEDIALKIINQSGTCTLITLDSTGQPRARIMDPFQPERSFVIWFGTNMMSRKVKEIEANQQATVIYYDKASASYVSLYGRAEIIRNEAAKTKYWKNDWQNFYPDYPKGYGLIKFTPDYLELISEEYEITGDPVTWKPTTIKF